MYGSKGRSGVGAQFTGENWQDFEQLSPNGRQMKQEDKRYVRDLSGQAFWNMRKEADPRFYDIKPEDYPTPSYYHQPKQAKAVPIPEELFDRIDTLIEKAEENEQNQKKESIFLTLKEGNVFRKMYEKFVK